MNHLIIEAIKNNCVLSCNYDGHDRMIEPHCYGYGNRGEELLKCFQVGGMSNSDPFAWKLFTVGKMKFLDITDQRFFEPREGYNPENEENIPSVIAKI